MIRKKPLEPGATWNLNGPVHKAYNYYTTIIGVGGSIQGLGFVSCLLRTVHLSLLRGSARKDDLGNGRELLHAGLASKNELR